MLASPVAAQQVAPTALPPGAALRLTLAGSALPLRPADNGDITLVAADTAFLWISGLTRGKSDSIAYQALRMIEVRTRDYSRPTVIGASAAGGAALAVLAVLSVTAGGRDLHDARARQLFISWGVPAAAGGALLGAVWSREHWRRISAPLQIVESAGTGSAR